MPVSRVPWVSVLVVLLGILGFVALRAPMADVVPVHFGVGGAPDRWSSPDELWVFLAGPLVVLGLDATLTPSLAASGDASAEAFARAMRRVLAALNVALVLLWWGTAWDIREGTLGAGFFVGLFAVLAMVPASFMAFSRVPLPVPAPQTGPRTWTSVLWYSNAQDARIWVPKTFGWGWTLNFAHRQSWVVLGATLLPVLALPVLALLLGS